MTGAQDNLPSVMAQSLGSDPTALDNHSKHTAGGWSSIIGIVTAIIGNVIISLALNTQRYAHVRLAREHRNAQDTRLSKRKGGKANGSSTGYGTIEDQIAEDRARLIAEDDTQPGDIEGGLEDSDEDQRTHETDALIPRTNGRRRDEESDRTEKNGDDEAERGDTDEKERKSYLRSPLWWLGIGLMITGEAGNFLAYGFAPASIVSPLGVVAIISNCLIAPIMLRERFRKRDALGVVIATGGAVTVVLSAQGSNPKLSPDIIWDLINRWEFLTYLGITLALIVLLMIASNRIGEKTIAIDLGLVGLLGGYTALSTKGIASLLSYSLWRVITFGISYLLAAILVLSAVLQVKYVNRALQRFDSTQVIPTQFVAFTIFVIVGSAVLYRDFEKATTESALKFVGGCALTFLGVWCITNGRRGNLEEDIGAEEERSLAKLDEEQHIDLVDDEGPSTPRASSSGPRRQQQSNADSTNAGPESSNSSTSRPDGAPPLIATISSPTVPSSSTNSLATSVPSHEPGLYLTSSGHHSTPHLHTDPQTPPRRSSAHILNSSTPTMHAGSVASRSSISSFLTSASPGPLSVPLSSGLSVVVADERGRLRRNSSVRATTVGRGAANAVREATAQRHQTDGEIEVRPRVGRGASVEVTSRLRDEETNDGRPSKRRDT